MNNLTNFPKLSSWIGWTFSISTLAILVVFTYIGFFTDFSMQPMGEQAIFFVTEIAIIAILAVTTLGFYRTKYVVRDGEFYSWSPFAVIRFKLKDVKSVSRTIVPTHFRVGASFYSGLFFIPSIGWTKSIITNLSDGLIIELKDKTHFLITPSHPEKFAKVLKK